MMLIVHFGAIVLTALALNEVLPAQFHYDTTENLALFTIVLGILNLVLRPILQVLALPLTCLTLGLFALVVNAVTFYLGGYLLSGIEVTWTGAFVGSLLLGALTGVLSGLVRSRR